MQETLAPKKIVYHSEFYNVCNETEQWIRLTDGCFRSCWNCYCPKEKRVYKLPEIVRNKVVFLDMNFLWAHPNPEKILQELAEKRVKGNVVYYDFYCGLDFTLLNPTLVHLCNQARVGWFNNKRLYNYGLRLAWDRGLKEQYKMKDVVGMMEKVGYRTGTSQCFMLCNGLVTYEECVKKLKLLLRWGMGVRDCWFDNQRRGDVIPVHWKKWECEAFGKMCREHNLIIKYGIYPEVKP